MVFGPLMINNHLFNEFHYTTSSLLAQYTFGYWD